MRENYLDSFFKSKKPIIIFVSVAIIFLIIVGYSVATSMLRQQLAKSYAGLQSECATQAKNFTDNVQNSNNSIQYSYTSHYSSNLKKCYDLIHGVGVAGVGLSDTLVDISGNKIIIDCESYTSSPSQNFCSYDGVKDTYNINNFNDYIKSYMEIK